MIDHCHICYTMDVEPEFVCDRCDLHYCDECSYSFNLHYQFEGSRCHLCSDQPRRNRLDKILKRDNKIKLILHCEL